MNGENDTSNDLLNNNGSSNGKKDEKLENRANTLMRGAKLDMIAEDEDEN